MKHSAMKKFFNLALAISLTAVSFTSCEEDRPYELTKPKEETKDEYTVDNYGYATFEHEGFTFKLKSSLVETEAAKKAITHMKDDLDKIISFCPASALKVIKKNPIWMEESHKVSTSAAWYHKWEGYPASIGDLSAKRKCVEVTNYGYYVSWSNQNQPLMIFHELSHLYHDQGLGGDNNSTINKAYKNAKDNGLYKGTAYRYKTTDPKSKWDYKAAKDGAYCMTDAWEFFAEMSEAYWGENDYYPINYDDLKEYDPVAFSAMETIWGKRSDKN